MKIKNIQFASVPKNRKTKKEKKNVKRPALIRRKKVVKTFFFGNVFSPALQ